MLHPHCDAQLKRDAVVNHEASTDARPPIEDRLPEENTKTVKTHNRGSHPSKCDGRPEGPKKLTVRRNMERWEPV